MMVRQMSNKLMGNLIGILLVLLAFVPLEYNPNVVPVTPVTPSINLDIDKPTDEVLALVSPVSSLITDKQDRIKIAVFNYCFSKRVEKYDVKLQQLQDLYVLAASHYLKDSVKDKYEDLDKKLVELFEKSVGSDDHILSAADKINLKSNFSGLAWSLIK